MTKPKKNRPTQVQQPKKFQTHAMKKNTDKPHKSIEQNRKGQNTENRNGTGDGIQPYSEDESYFASICSSVAIWCGVLVLFVTTLHPSVPGGDSGELITSAYELGVAHPPGYPLFTLCAKLFLYIPLNSPAWRINLLSSVFGATAALFLHLTLYRLTYCRASSLLGTLIFSLSRLTWTWSITGEVFSLNNLFVCALMFSAVLFDNAKDTQSMQKMSKWGAFLCGLSLCNQHTIIIYVFCIVLWSMHRLWSLQALDVKQLVSLGVYFLAGLCPYIYLPVSAWLNGARWTWGDQRSIAGFLKHLLRQEYGTLDLGKNEIGQGFYVGLYEYYSHVVEDLSLPIIVFGVAGIFFAASKARKGQNVLVVFTAMLISYASIFAWRANLDTTNKLYKGVVERFWMQSDIVVVCLATCGFSTVLSWCYDKLGVPNDSVIRRLFISAAIAVFAAFYKDNYLLCSQSNNWVVHDFAKNLLNQMPPHAIVLTKGDLPSNAMRYFHLCENFRPDLQILDQEVLSYKWSLPMMGKFYTNISFPGDYWDTIDRKTPEGKTSFSFLSLLKKNIKRHPIVLCIGMQEKDESWNQKYNLQVYGVCHKVIEKEKQLDPYQLGRETINFTNEWKYQHSGFDDTSWEKVANDEMWHAKISTPFYLYQLAVQTTDNDAKMHLYWTSYQLYKKAITENSAQGFPSFWHKNFALVCERLSHVNIQSNLPVLTKGLSLATVPSELCKEAAQHFKAYLQLEPEDPENGKIQEAISTLQGRQSMLEGLEKLSI